ncbi:DUF1559 domain-containing protein [Tundrisphaera sp. TA3]|uniref:DUF1559 family PulG-like putative transporter n=1 Tax=Tundrisphaera sp. TA3 TaxID=3435775 RepID=UPI003EB71131
MIRAIESFRRAPAARKAGVLAIVLGLLAGSVGLGRMAIEASRESARRSQCQLNLKLIGIALSNYQVANDCFVPAALPGEGTTPDRRVGWPLAVLPYLFCPHCWGMDNYGRIDFAKSWDAGVAEPYGYRPITYLECPSSAHAREHDGQSGGAWGRRQPAKILEPTTYVGVTGLGPDAAALPKTDRRAGMFGDDRRITPADLRDGAATTMMVAETADLRPPWTAGGSATTRCVDPAKRPHLGPGRPFGGNHPGRTEVLFADGSVRPIRDGIAPEVFEALSTIAGGEALPGGWDR